MNHKTIHGVTFIVDARLGAHRFLKLQFFHGRRKNSAVCYRIPGKRSDSSKKFARF